MLQSINWKKASVYLSMTLLPSVLSAQVSFDQAPSNLTVECDGLGNTADLENFLSNHGNAQASTTCSNAEITWSHDVGPLSDNCSETGSYDVTFIASDNCGESISALVTFMIEDTTAPVITEALDVSVDCDEACITSEFLNWLSNSASSIVTDECSQVNWSNDFPGGCPFANETTVTFTVTDECSNSSQVTATFYVDQFCVNDNDCSNGTEIWSPETCGCTIVESVEGCLDPTALNFDPLANCDNASCVYPDTNADDQTTEDEIGEIVVDQEDLDSDLEDEPQVEPDLNTEPNVDPDILDINAEVDTETTLEPNDEAIIEECILSIPNAFSPNDDGYNDSFKVFGDDDCFNPELQLFIYNRWGNQVFHSPSVVLNTTGWDGTNEGVSAELGAHVYKVIYTDKTGVSHVQSGVVTLIR